MLVSLTPIGCVKSAATLPPPAQPNPAPPVASDAALRVRTLQTLARNCRRLDERLPGDDADAHRRLMAEFFAQLTEILPVLEGPSPGAEFAQRLQVISDAQRELAAGPGDLSPEPTIDTGLRAARDALSGIARDSFYDQISLTPLFDQLSAKIGALDSARGPLHRLDAAQAAGDATRIILEMTQVLQRRLSERPAAATNPAR